ncbi:MAG TPA: hypothetical protein VHW00_18580 [Thermoanaerobaculia bacterium]|nr:hypothetical protein [Thermoanaerobaculia bacterium]
MLLLAFVVAGQLTLHQHNLIPEAGSAATSPCPVCAFGADQASIETPLFGDVLDFVGYVAAGPDPRVLSPLVLPTAVRGPPSLAS